MKNITGYEARLAASTILGELAQNQAHYNLAHIVRQRALATRFLEYADGQSD